MNEDLNMEKKGWLARLKTGLQRSTSKVTENLSGFFTKRKLDDEALAELEDILIQADLGPVTACNLVEAFAKNRFGKDVTDVEIRSALAEQISEILAPLAVPLVIDSQHKPFTVLIVGVNGTGKTTTIGKMAQFYKNQGLKVMMAAGDTFRAAAISQLKIWGERIGCPVISGVQDGDAAALAYQALEAAQKEEMDLLLIDTAGRLHNKTGLMDELAKIVRVLKKKDETAPHATLLVLDATTGQNAHAQLEAFRALTNVTGLVITKLDGSAKGGVVVALADRFRMPIYAIGVGEKAEDLRPFLAEDFARSLFGVG